METWRKGKCHECVQVGDGRLQVAEVFPDSWFVPERLEDVIEWLQAMPISPEDKKAILHEWSAHAGVHLTGENIEAVTGHPAGVI